MIFNEKYIREFIKSNRQLFLNSFLKRNSQYTEELFDDILNSPLYANAHSLNIIPNFFIDENDSSLHTDKNSNWDEDKIILQKDYPVLGESVASKFLSTQNSDYRFLRYTEFVEQQFSLIQHDIKEICKKYDYCMEYGLNEYALKESVFWNTGHLPLFKDDMFQLHQKEYYLTPTTEVNYLAKYTNCKLEQTIKRYKFRQCFRREGGVHGARDSYIRFNQFFKNELFILTSPSDTKDYSKEMVDMCCELLNKYKITHRVLRNSIYNTSATSHYTYDVECWSPSKNRYIELSSCSKTGIYQTSRCNIKFNNEQFAVSYNGTFIAMERILFCLLDNGIIL